MNLEELRNRIDSLDAEIVRLLNERSGLAREVGRWKQEHQLPIYVPEREQQLLARLQERNAGPLDAESLEAIYREIISAAIKLERPVSVAFLGPEGTFSHQAAREKFGHGAVLMPLPTIGDVFQAVEARRVDYGMVPVENSIEGVVNPTLDTLRGSSVKIVAEFELPVHLMLFGEGPVESVRCVYSHPQPFGQCREFLQAKLRNATLIEVASTARAVELAAREGDAAAIAGRIAGEAAGLPLLAENIEDNPRNTTRFLVIGRQENGPSGNDKTSLCFTLHDRAGALYDALRPFRNHNISMSMIESRPLRSGSWEYCFFIDIGGHQSEPALSAACAELKADCSFFKVFGSYPACSGR